MPRIILMDISMPILNGIEATRQIMAKKPACKVVIISAHGGNEYADRAKEAGAWGYVPKLMSAEALTWAIREVAMGRRLSEPVSSYSPFDQEREPELNSPSKNQGKRLTLRESEVLELMAEGLPKTGIAAKLRVSSSSIEKHFGVLMTKLGVPSISGLVARAGAIVCVENDVELKIIRSFPGGNRNDGDD